MVIVVRNAGGFKHFEMSLVGNLKAEVGPKGVSWGSLASIGPPCLADSTAAMAPLHGDTGAPKMPRSAMAKALPRGAPGEAGKGSLGRAACGSIPRESIADIKTA